MRSSAPSSAATRSIFGRTGTRPTGAFWPRICAIPRARNGKRALSENLTKQPLLRNFLPPLNREELDVGPRHPLGLQQQIPQVLIAPAAVNQHTNVPVHRFPNSQAYFLAAFGGGGSLVGRTRG